MPTDTELVRRPRRAAPPDRRDIIRIETDSLIAPRLPPTDHAQQRMCASVARFGILRPLLVRPDRVGTRPRFCVIDGCRRLYAAIACGMPALPCVLADDDDASDFAEQYHRLADDYFAQADLLADRLAAGGETQQMLADRLGLSQSAVANKLRLRRLSHDQRKILFDHRLSERHARALVSVPPEQRETVLRRMTDGGLTVAQTEALVESLSMSGCEPTADKLGRQQKAAIRDIGFFYNSIEHAVALLQRVGGAVRLSRDETPDAVTLTIRIACDVSRETSDTDPAR